MRKVTQSRLVRLATAVQRRASSDDLGTHAAALTYQAFLSILPLALLALTILGALLRGHDRADWLDRIDEAVPGLDAVLGRPVGLGFVAAAALLWTGSAVARRATHALATVFRTDPRGTVVKRLRGLLDVVVLATMFGGALALTGIAPDAVALRLVSFVAIATAELGFFLAAYRLLTPGGPAFRAHLPGALFATVGWQVLKLAGGLLVVKTAARATALYGTVGSVIGIFVFLSLASKLFLYGAELSATLAEERA